jgi:alpha-L-fucosidase 2
MKILLPALALLMAHQTHAAAQTQQISPPRQKGALQSTLMVQDRVNWPQFLARHDLTWHEIPTHWESGAFVGNGLLGAMIYSGEHEGQRDALRWDINRSDVVDRGHRLPIGQLVLQPQGAVQSTSGDDEVMRLDLWNAEARGVLQTDKGSIRWRSFTHATEPLIIIDYQTTGGENGAKFNWRALPAVDPRKTHNKEPIPENEQNPAPVETRQGDVTISTQKLQKGEYAVAWRERQIAPNRKVLFLSIASLQPPSSDKLPASRLPGASEQALHTVNGVANTAPEVLANSHRDWWHQYLPQSFVSLPDTRLESFYWIQMYKLGSAMRANGPILDLMGPWFRSTPWPAIWWNLNIQLTYWPVYTANRLELGESLTRALDANAQTLANNVRPEWRNDSAYIGRTSSYDLKSGEWKELGNLTWALHNYWLHYRHTMDEAMLRDRLFPLLKRSVNYYLHRLEEGADGKYHLPVVISPEYPTEAADTNYDLSLLRWGLQTLMETNARLKLNDPLLSRWQEVLGKLTPYPVDEKSGLMIGRDVPLAQSHRHFSHLLMFYPLYTMNPEQPENRALLEKSLDHWIGFQGALQGYSYTGASSMSSALGRRDDAVRLLNDFLTRYVKPNTMYLEAGPVIETPLAGAQSIHDILMTSWGNKIRLFPGVPSSWRDVTFHNLRAQGGFSVSASRRNGQTQWVRIQSLAGEPCVLQFDESTSQSTLEARGMPSKVLAPGLLQLDLKRGQSVLLQPRGSRHVALVEPVAAQPQQMNVWGSRKVLPIAQAADGSFDLHASNAVIHGDKMFYEKAGRKDNLGHWVENDDWATWKLTNTRVGRYKVLLTYASPGSGSTFTVGIGAQKVNATVQRTGSFETFQEFAIGEFQLPAGRVELEVRALDIKGALFNLQRVRLVPVK